MRWVCIQVRVRTFTLELSEVGLKPIKVSLYTTEDEGVYPRYE